MALPISSEYRVTMVHEVPMGIPDLQAPRDLLDLMDILAKLDFQESL